MADYWLADSEARVLGPVSLELIRDLAAKGKLTEVRAASRDGQTFLPLAEVPELHQVLSSPAGAAEQLRAQAHAAAQIRSWLELIEGRSTADVFRVAPTASKEAYRAAFFGIIQRYVPSRLPPDATLELREACEEAFLHLAERMVEVEQQFRKERARPAPAASPAALVSWRGGMLHVKLTLARGDARPFTADPESNWRSDSFVVTSPEKVMVNSPTEVSITFEGHVTPLSASGRVVGVKTTYPLGFAVKLLDLDEAQRSMVRSWVNRSR